MEQAKTVSRTLDPSAVPGRRIFEACTLTYCSTRGGHRERSGASVLTTSTLHDSILLQFCSVEFLLVLGSFARVPSAVSALVPSRFRSASASHLFFSSFLFLFHFTCTSCAASGVCRSVLLSHLRDLRALLQSSARCRLRGSPCQNSNPARGIEQRRERNPSLPPPHPPHPPCA